jgi:hypothetical protein
MTADALQRLNAALTDIYANVWIDNHNIEARSR